MFLVTVVYVHILNSDYKFTENNEQLDLMTSEDAAPDMENSSMIVELGKPETPPKRQFKTAEIADAVMATETPIDQSDIESLLPKNMKEYHTGFTPPCDEISDQCASSANDAKQETNAEPSQQVLYKIYQGNKQNIYTYLKVELRVMHIMCTFLSF